MFGSLFGLISRNNNSNRPVSSQDEEFSSRVSYSSRRRNSVSSRRRSSVSSRRRNSEDINFKNNDDNESDDDNDYDNDNDKDYDKKYNNSNYYIFKNYWNKRLSFLSNEKFKSSIRWLLDSAFFELRISVSTM